MAQKTLEQPAEITPLQQLEEMLPTALLSREELQQIPAAERLNYPPPEQFVFDALMESLDEPEEVVESWQLATRFLQALSTTSEEKEVWNAQHQRDTVTTVLAKSLNAHRATADTAAIFLDALMITMDGGKLHTPLDVSVSDAIVRNHHTLRYDADKETQRAYKTFLDNPDTFDRLGDAVYYEHFEIDDENDGEFFGDEDEYETGLELCEDLLHDLGIADAEPCLLIWGDARGEHLRRIAKIERERPGAAALLHGFYGIRQFGRYSTDHLLRQYDAHGDALKPYGVQIKAEKDWNKAFSESWGGRVDTGLGQLERGGEYFVRSIEASDSHELLRRMAALDRLYGAQQNIAFVVVDAHGKPELMELGGGERALGSLVLQHNYGATREWFIENPTILLASCSTGQEGGIAQEISRQLHATVIAPGDPAGVETLVAVETNGKLKLEPTFGTGNSLDKEGRRYSDAMLYMNGARIEQDDQRYKAYFAEAKEPMYPT